MEIGIRLKSESNNSVIIIRIPTSEKMPVKRKKKFLFNQFPEHLSWIPSSRSHRQPLRDATDEIA